MRFIALDVETANADLSSICQIGIVVFTNGIIDYTWKSLVDPEDDFDAMNIYIHGITPEMVENEPSLPEIAEKVRGFLLPGITATHTAFDKSAIGRAFEKYHLKAVETLWLDTARVVRRAWPQFARKGYGLKNVAEEFGIKFRSHDAEEDARAAGEILLKAIADTGISLGDWLIRVNQPILHSPSGSSRSRVAREGKASGPLEGEVIVFTGALSISRGQAAELAAQAGSDVRDSVNAQVTILVVGDQDIRRLAGKDKSTKHRMVEELIARGHPIRIVGESDFRRLVGK